MDDCDSESVVGFKCPATHELPPNAVARRFLPYPRFPLPDDPYAYIVCVYDRPRIQYCGHGSYFDEQTLSCVYEEIVHHDDVVDEHVPVHHAGGGGGGGGIGDFPGFTGFRKRK